MSFFLYYNRDLNRNAVRIIDILLNIILKPYEFK